MTVLLVSVVIHNCGGVPTRKGINELAVGIVSLIMSVVKEVTEKALKASLLLPK